MAGAARDDGTAAEQPDAERGTHERRECMACRGTGQVISNLGGSPSDVACPWCEGSGLRIPGIDAQAPWREREGAADEASGEAPPPGAGGTPGGSPDASR